MLDPSSIPLADLLGSLGSVASVIVAGAALLILWRHLDQLRIEITVTVSWGVQLELTDFGLHGLA